MTTRRIVNEYVQGKVVIELPDTIVSVIDAAVDVCNTRYSDSEWDELNSAIGRLIGALQNLGVKFNNPRIG